jgi:hypothetical protein
VIPPREIDTIIDNIGIPNGGFNLAFGDNPTLGVREMATSWLRSSPRTTAPPRNTGPLRKRLHERFPTWCSSSKRPISPTRF